MSDSATTHAAILKAGLEAKNEHIRFLEEEVARLRSRLLMALGDDQCQFTAEELRDIADGKKKLPPKEIFLPSCAAFHDRHSGEHGVLESCLTLAQSLAESEGLRIELAAANNRIALLMQLLESIGAAWKQADEERLKETERSRDEANKWQSQGDGYGYNFHSGVASGTVGASLCYDHVRRQFEQAMKELKGEEVAGPPAL